MKQRETCAQGHDNISPYTRYSNGECCECSRTRNREKKRAKGVFDSALYCRNGHPRGPDSTYKNGRCKRCTWERGFRYRADRDRDPLGLTSYNERNRIRLEAKRRAAGVKPRNWSEETLRKRTRKPLRGVVRVVPSGPFVEWLTEYRVSHPDEYGRVLAASAESSTRTLLSLCKGDRGRVRLEVVDRFLVAAGEPYLLNVLYPFDERRD